MQCGNDRLFLGACNADVLDTEVCIQHFMQDTALFRAALPDGRQSCVQSHFRSHKACQFFKEPQICLFSLGAVPLVRAGQIKAIFSSSSRKRKLFLDVFTKLVAISLSGKNQGFPAIRPVIEVFGQDFGLVKREPIGILDAAIKIDGFKVGRLCRLVSESKRLLRKGLAFQQLGISATDHFPHEQEGMENIALSGCICAVQCQHRHKLFLLVRRNQAIRQTFIRRCFQAADYRRVALYGLDYLIEEKKKDKANCGCGQMTDDVIRLREEIAEQIKCLEDMKKLAEIYGYDISRPATNAKEAVQWLYFGYLAAIKTQNGAAMSVGRVSTFLDIYIKRDMDKGILTEQEAQELIDHFTMKLRMVKFARIPSYNQLFSGDPVWATLDVAGTGVDGRSMVTKTDFRFLHTLENMGPAPEPNLTVFYSSKLPQTFKDYAARISIETSSIQYENDDAMKPVWGDDYAICCCVSATQTGKEMQFFGARANLAKCLLYAINGGVDEKSGEQVGPNYAPITAEYLDYDEVMAKYDKMMDWLVDIYVNTLNLIQYMHDKYYYEAAELALMDTDLKRTFATGIAGFSHVIDSLSAIKYAKVKVVRDESGLAKDFEIEGEFPKYGNDDDRADEIGVWLLKTFMDKLKKHHTYRDSEPTTSILTITSNVVYGKATGAMPDGRKAGEPLSPGANPSYGAEQNGLLASLNSLTKLPYEWALDGISNTQTINPGALGNNEGERIDNLVNVMDGYFDQGAHHLNVNVFGKEKLIDAMEHPEKEEYANFTIRVSGYAVKFIDLTREQQLDVISRTCHERM